MFWRRIYDDMLLWKKENHGKKALMIEGARRIGKSTIVEEFARNEYDRYLLIDFNDASLVVRDAFEKSLNNLDEFFMILGTEYGVELIPKRSLVIFDEVQAFPKARQSIKKLVADGRYDYIETGSLISIRENVESITIPSEEKGLRMFPMDFEEFCLASGEAQMVKYIRECFEKEQPLAEDLHHKAMLIFKQYMLVGGMPQSVAAYLDNNRSFSMADAEKRDILRLYKNDIKKADKKYQSKVAAIFDQIPAFLSKHEKRVRLSNVEVGSAYPSYEETFFWLGDSMIANECFSCTDPNVGLAINEERTAIKCYMGDTGLLVSHAFTEKEVEEEKLYKNILHDHMGINEGMLFENVIAQCLVARGYPLYFYTRYNSDKHRNDIEIDFILSNKSKVNPRIYPIEVKSSKRYTTVSLDRFKEAFGKRVGGSFIIHTKNLSRTGDTLCIPAYMTMCL